MITLYRRGRVWWASVCRDGLQRRQSLRTRDRQVAETLRRGLELELLGGGRLLPKRWSDFEREFRSWIEPQIRPRTLKAYCLVLDRLNKFLTGQTIRDVRDIAPDVIASFMDSRKREIHPSRKRPMTEGGVKHDLRVLHRVFSYAVECAYLDRNPVRARSLNSTPGQTLPFSPEEVKRMLTSSYLAQRPQLRAIVQLFLHTGLRIGDIIGLRRENLAGGMLTLKTRKRHTVVRLPLHPDVLAALNDMAINGHNSPYVFTTAAGQPIVSLDKHLRRLWNACGILGGHAHRFRDTFAVRLLEQGASLYDVAKLLGVSHQTAERHYSPYVRELQERGARLVRSLAYTA